MKRFIILIVCLTALDVNAQTFKIDTISDALYQRMLGKSYKANCTIPRSELRYLQLSHFDAKGDEHIGEMVCNGKIANDLLNIFQELYKAKYPIERMKLIDNYDADDDKSMRDNNTSCFNFRTISGSNKLSKHSQGMAIDINPLYNPYVKRRSDGTLLVQPANARKYANRAKKWAYKIEKGDLCYRLFREHGFLWGGGWSTSKDYQHFER